MIREIPIEQFTYELPDEKIAKFPLPIRHNSKLLVYKDQEVSQRPFHTLAEELNRGDLMVFNNTKVIQARIIFFKESGARVEVFCLEPDTPAHYESAFSVVGKCRWKALVGGRKRWKSGALTINFDNNGRNEALSVELIENIGRESIVEFTWDENSDLSFGEILHILGKIPIPPYLCRESCENDLTTYQTVYSKIEGSVAAPTAGLHFTDEVFDSLKNRGVERCEVTLHVGAGTFLPVKSENAAEHTMHIEHFEVSLSDIKRLEEKASKVVAVGTTSVRTVESLSVLGYRCMVEGKAREIEAVAQWEAYDIPEDISGAELLGALAKYMECSGKDKIAASTAIMITPGYRFRVVGRLITNFHQPQSTLLLLINAAVGDNWRNIYNYALDNDFRFLSYGDSSILIVNYKL
ncbi:MAG: S-adenosylmethionine:tRNA ribosyltransferase-isomerase [Rikenellaceae bacterium]